MFLLARFRLRLLLLREPSSVDIAASCIVIGIYQRWMNNQKGSHQCCSIILDFDRYSYPSGTCRGGIERLDYCCINNSIRQYTRHIYVCCTSNAFCLSDMASRSLRLFFVSTFVFKRSMYRIEMSRQDRHTICDETQKWVSYPSSYTLIGAVRYGASFFILTNSSSSRSSASKISSALSPKPFSLK